MITSCEKLECTEPPKYFCCCRDLQTFLYPAHIISHIDENEGSKNLLQTMYKNISPEKKAYMIEQCTLVSEGLKDIEISFSISFQTAINTLNERKNAMIKYFREKKESLQLIIDKITNENKKIVVPGYEVHDPYQLNCLNFLKGLTYKIAYETESFTQKLHCYSEEMLEKKDIFGEFLDFTGNANLDEHLYGFKKGTKTFIEFNTLTLSITRRDLEVDTNQGCLACLCQIPNEKLFYTGGYDPCIYPAIIIDLKTFKIEKISQIRDRAVTFATYYNDFVYIFGGLYSYNTFINFYEKYNLVSKEWVNIAKFPEPDRDYICALPCKDYFILSSFRGNNLYKYNTLEDSYLNLTSSVQNIEANILFRNLKKYYYISSNNLFTSTENNLSLWVKNPKQLSTTLTANTSKPVTKGKFVYIMATYTSQIFKFDLVLEDLFLVTSF